MDGYYLELNKKCVNNPIGLNEVANCKRYQNFHQCSQCEPHHYLSENQTKCLKIGAQDEKIIHCQIYSSKDQCEYCSTGILSSNKKECTDITSEIPHCAFFYKTSHCSQCKSGYTLNENYYIDNPSLNYPLYMNTIESYYMNYKNVLDLPTCQQNPHIINCKSLDENSEFCLECLDGFYLSEDKKSCDVNPNENQNKLEINIRFCYKAELVIEKKNNIEFSIYLCKMCFKGYYLSSDNRKCKKHTKEISNCEIMSQTEINQCIKCSSGYYRANIPDQPENLCHLRGDSKACKEFDLNSQKCKTCEDPTFIKHYDDRYCSQSIPFCVTYEKTSVVLSCAICEKFYYYNSKLKKCLKNTGSQFDPFCEKFNSDKTCGECAYGYFYNLQTAKCETNTQEFNDLSKCYKFSHLNKDECVECKQGDKLLSVNNTCKLYTNSTQYYHEKMGQITIPSGTVDLVDKCEQFEIRKNKQLRCVLPRNPTNTQIESLNCQNKTQTNQFSIHNGQNNNIDDCNLYYVDTTSWKPVLLDRQINNQQITCKEYLSEFEGLGVKCKQCYDSIEYVNQKLTANNTCASEIEIPFCLSTQRYSVNHNSQTQQMCNRPFDVCGYVEFYSDSTQTTPFLSVDSCNPISSPQCSSTAQYQNSDGSIQTYCQLYSNTNCTKAVFTRNYTNNIIYFEQHQLCIEDVYAVEIDENDKCVQKSSDESFCEICIRNFYPNNEQVFFKKIQKVEPYNDHASKPSMEFCIYYDSINQQCKRCVGNYKINNSTKICIDCSLGNRVTDKSRLLCIEASNPDILSSGQCQQGVQRTNTQNIFDCVKCIEQQLPDYDIHITNEFEYVEYWTNENKKKTFIEKQIKNWKINECSSYANVFFLKTINSNKVNNCEWGKKTPQGFYCKKCKFGFSGDSSETTLGEKFVEGCSYDTLCDDTAQIFIKKPQIRNLISCHVCKTNNYLPTIFFYFKQFKTNNNQLEWLYSSQDANTAKSNYCFINMSNVENCMIQIKWSDTDLVDAYNVAKGSLPAASGDSVFICGACKPMYTPTYVDSSQGIYSDKKYYPTQFVTNCALIANCKYSRTANECEECEENYYLDGNSCVLIDQADTHLQNCQTVLTTTVASTTTKTCTKCKNGFIFTNKCVEYKVDGCEYYNADVCLQSIADMGVGLNILYEFESNNFKEKQIKCDPVSSQISNCLYYSSQTECLQCEQDYLLKEDKSECKKIPIPNCVEYSFIDKIACKKCEIGYIFKTADIQDPVLLTPFSTQTCEQDIQKQIQTQAEDPCQTYEQNKCIQCREAGFSPILINNMQNTVCVNQTFTKLCEVMDYESFRNEGILNCLLCKTIESIQQSVQNNEIILNEYDFFDKETYQSYVDVSGQINYTELYTNITDIRVNLYQYNGYKFCKNFYQVANCKEYQVAANNQTYLCSLCEDDFYLSTTLIPDSLFYKQTCHPRVSSLTNCLSKNPTSDSCESLEVTSGGGLFNYSNFDLEVIANPPPEFNESSYTLNNVPYCEVYYSNQECQYCQNNYYILENMCLTVTQVVEDCKYYKSDGKCAVCLDNFLEFEDKCLIKYAENCESYLSNTRCLTCQQDYPLMGLDGSCYKQELVANCLTYESTTKCMICKQGYTLDSLFRCASIGEGVIANCAKYFKLNICYQCESGYTLSKDQLSCTQNDKFDRNCQTFSLNLECSMCEDGFYKKDGYCVQCETTDVGCRFCDPSNPTQCSLCKSGFFMNIFYKCVRDTSYSQSRIRTVDEMLENFSQLDREYDVRVN